MLFFYLVSVSYLALLFMAYSIVSGNLYDSVLLLAFLPILTYLWTVIGIGRLSDERLEDINGRLAAPKEYAKHVACASLLATAIFLLPLIGLAKLLGHFIQPPWIPREVRSIGTLMCPFAALLLFYAPRLAIEGMLKVAPPMDGTYYDEGRTFFRGADRVSVLGGLLHWFRSKLLMRRSLFLWFGTELPGTVPVVFMPRSSVSNIRRGGTRVMFESTDGKVKTWVTLKVQDMGNTYAL